MPPHRTLGFGFDPGDAPYHFTVTIPRDGAGPVVLCECLTWDAASAGRRSPSEPAPGSTSDSKLPTPAPDSRPKAILDFYRWSRIADPARAHFNRRLRDAGRRSAAWKLGENHLAPYLGKELVLLAWAVEDADPTLIPNMLANWLGLAPEERWWLYTTIDATSTHPDHGRDRGWRKAIKIAFAENPAAAPPATLDAPEPPRRPALTPSPRTRTKRRADPKPVDLFGAQQAQFPLLAEDAQ